MPPRTPLRFVLPALGACAIVAAPALGSPAGTITTYATPAASGTPVWLTASPSGLVWYSTDHAAHVVAVDSSGAVQHDIAVPGSNRTFGITSTADGRVWFVNEDNVSGQYGVGRVDADGSNPVHFPVGAGVLLQHVTVGGDGNVWAIEWQGGSVIRVTPTGTVTPFTPTPAVGTGYTIAAAPDGDTWYVDLNGAVGRVTPAGVITQWSQNDDPRIGGGLAGIAMDGSGNAWITNERDDSVIEVSPTGAVLARYVLPTPPNTGSAGPRQIALGPDGNMWIAMCGGDAIGRITPAGTITWWSTSGVAGAPYAIIWGPDGDMWFTSLTAPGALGRIGTGESTAPPAPGGGGTPGGGGGTPGGGNTGGGAPDGGSTGGGQGGSPFDAGVAGSSCAAPPEGRVGVSINGGAQYTNDPKVTLDVVWPTCTTSVLVANDGGFHLGETRPVQATIPWTLNSSGPERLPKTVYLRFGDATQNYTDDIILDETAPQVTSAVATPAQGASEVLARRRTSGQVLRVRVTAVDHGSGPAVIEVQRGSRRATVPYGQAATIPVGRGVLRARVKDAAGNWSRPKRVRTR